MKRRRLLKLAAFLILGAIVNVAVAWACAVWVDVDKRNVENVTAQTAATLKERGLMLSEDADFYGARAHGFGLTLISAILETQPSHIIVLTDAGWPRRSLRGEVHMIDHPRRADEVLISGAIELSDKIRARNKLLPLPYVLPLKPRWPDFAINTLFYVAIVWLLSLGPFALRRALRRRRGRCVKCGYDLRGAAHDACPECGKPMTKQKAKTQKAEIA